MPWKVFEEGSQYCVYRVNEDGEAVGETLGCHETREDANAHVAALYANEPGAGKAAKTKTEDGKEFTASAYLYVPDRDSPSTWKLRIEEEPGKVTVAQLGRAAAALGPGFRGQRVELPPDDRRAVAKKLIGKYRAQGVDDEDIPEYLWDIAGMEKPAGKAILAVKALGGNRIGGYAVLWGDESRKDLTGEYFTPETQELTAIFNGVGALPDLYHHAADDAMKATVIGKVDIMQADDVGLWYEAQLDASNRYKEAFLKLVREGVLGTSTGTLPGARQVDKSGRIVRWPIVEISQTPMPCEPRMMERPVSEIKAAFKALGLELPTERSDGEGAEEARRMAIEREREALALLEIEEALFD